MFYFDYSMQKLLFIPKMITINKSFHGLRNTTWKQIPCNCWYFLKIYVCRHVLFLAVAKKKIKVPLAYRGVLIDNKQRRDRISKTMKAFEVQD